MSNGISAFLEGLKTPLAGFEFMGQNPKLWRYGISSCPIFALHIIAADH
jgi:hypothetical protein